MDSIVQIEDVLSTRVRNLDDYDSELEMKINKEFQQVLNQPDHQAKRIAFERMTILVAQRSAVFIKAMERSWIEVRS